MGFSKFLSIRAMVFVFGKLKLQFCLISNICDKVFQNGLSKIYGRYPLKKLKRYGLLRQTLSLDSFLNNLSHVIFMYIRRLFKQVSM